MEINKVTATRQSGIGNASALESENAAAGNTTSKSMSEAAIYERCEQTNSKSTQAYTRDSVKLSEISSQVDAKLASLRATVENLIAMQTIRTGEAARLTYDQILEKYNGNLRSFYQNLEVDAETRLKAQQEISEDGFWGVKQTTDRTIEFAKALAGGDPSKVAMLRDAIEEGYRAAEKAWGGELPEICRQTRAAVQKGLDEWANESVA